MTTTKTTHVLTAATLILSLLAQFLTPLATLAQEELPAEDTVVGPPAPDIVGLPGGPAGPPSELAPLPPGRPKNPAQILAETRRDDARACQAESTAGTGFSAFKPESLQNALADDIGQALPPIVNNALTNDLPVRVQNALQRELPSIITDGLRRELPQRLAPGIQRLTQGLTPAAASARLQEIVPGTNQTQFARLLNNVLLGTGGEESSLLQDILRDGLELRLPRIVAESARGSLGAHLGPGLNNSTEVFVRGQFGGQIGQMTSLIFEIIIPYVNDLIISIQAIGDGMIASGTALKDSLATCFSGGLSGFAACAQAFEQGTQLIAQGQALLDKVEEIGDFVKWLENHQANQEQLAEDMIQGLTIVIQESLTQGDTIERLTDALAADITGPVINSLEGGMDDIVAAFLGPANQAIASIENLPNVFLGPINDAVNNLVNTTTDVIDAQIRTVVSAITAPIDAIAASFSQTIEQTMTAALKPFTDTLTGAFAEAGNFIAAPLNIAAQQVNDFFLGNTDITLSPGSGPLYPNSYYQALQEPPSPLGPVADPFEGVMGPPAPPELPLTDTITGMASEGAGAANVSVNGVAEQAVASQPGLAGSLGNTLSQGLVGGVAGGLGSLVAGIPFVGGYAQNLVTQAVNAAFAAAGLSGAVGLAVPTMEIGALLSTEQSTNKIAGQIKGLNEQMKKIQEQLLKTTAEIKSLQIESCTYLKTIRRVQYAFEEKEFIYDPEAKKALGRALEYHNRKLFGDLLAGRAPSNAENLDPQKDKEPVVPENLNAAIDQGRQEVTGAFLDELKQIDSPFKNEIRAKLDSEQNQTFAERIKPTLSQEEYRKITSGEDFSWDTWLELIKPQNTPAGAEYLAREELARRQAVNEQNTREELLAGLGFLNTDECVKYSESGWCIERKTKTPGSVSQGYAVEGLTSVIRRTEGTEILDDYITPELETNLERLKDISDYSALADQSVYSQSDPCPGPGPCPDSGWGKIPAAKPAAAPAVAVPVPTTLTPPQITNSGTFTPLTLNLTLETPTLAEVADGAANATTIRWQSANAEECYASNNWLSANAATSMVTNGSPLPDSGERRISHPVDFDMSISRLAGGAGSPSAATLVKSDAADKLKKKIVFDARRLGEIQPDDVYRVTFASPNSLDLGFEIGGPGQVKPATPSTVVELISREIAKLKQGETALAAELVKYTFNYSSVGVMTVTPKLTYGLTCFQNANGVSQSVEIRR